MSTLMLILPIMLAIFSDLSVKAGEITRLHCFTQEISKNYLATRV